MKRITDEELKELLERADRLLGEYKKLAGKARKQLALRATEISGQRYSSLLGSYSDSVDTITVFPKDKASTHWKSLEFEDRWGKDLEHIDIWVRS